MRKVLYSLALAAIFLSCSNEKANDSSKPDIEGGYTIEGKIENLKEGKILLRQLIGRNAIIKDSATIGSDGTFSFKGKVEIPDFYQLLLPEGKFFVFPLTNEKLTFSADFNNYEPTKKLEGSKDNDAFQSITDEVNRRNIERNMLQAEGMKAQQENNLAKLDSLGKVFNEGEIASTKNIKKIISANTNSFIAAVGALQFVDPNTDFAFLDSISTEMAKNLPDSRYTQDLIAKVNSLRTVNIGSKAPEITQPTPTGEMMSLSSLKGKYVLIDFWASWCRPCRMENPNVVRIYNKYKNKNFEIFGVSLDKTKEAWVDAIQKDNITWAQVSDLQGWGAVPAAHYSVRSIPATFLIDPNGIIIAKDLRGEALEQKLKEILG